MRGTRSANVAAAFRLPRHNGTCRSVKAMKTQDEGFTALFRYSDIRRQLRPQAPLQLLAQLGHFHARHNDELAAQHFPRLVIIRQLAGNAAILAFLVPAEPSIRNGLWADKLKTAQKRIALWDLKLFSKDGDFHELFVWT